MSIIAASNAVCLRKERKVKTQWRHVNYHRLHGSELPRASGVYALLRVRRTLGVPLSVGVIYVGKSKNLQQRFLQHTDPYKQHNKVLNMIHDHEDMEFWYTPVNPGDLDSVERQLIRQLDPSANVVRYANDE